MNSNDPSQCGQCERVRDYAFDELPAPDRKTVEQHLAQCADCAAELDRLRLTTAALRVLPEQELPRRIAFVTDQPAAGWFAGIWNSAARLGFASACVMATALVVFAYHRPAEVTRTVAAASAGEISEAAIDDAVAKAVTVAVAQAVEKTHAEDVRLTRAALDEVDAKYARQQRNLMVAMQENLDYQKRKLATYAVLSSEERMGAGQ